MNYINTAIAVPSTQGVLKRPLKKYTSSSRDTKSGLVKA